MISISITNEMLRRIVAIESCKLRFAGDTMPVSVSARLRKISRKKSTFASNAIEGNPLSEAQANEAIESTSRHFLKPEEEIRNYYLALEMLDECLAEGRPFSKALVLEVQKLIVKGESAEKAGLRGPMPPGVLFAVYDSQTGRPEYIPPEASEVEPLLDELVRYVEESDDHPLVKAGVIHYQLVTIHPFEDGNGRTARIMSGYYLGLSGFGFGGIGSLDEYFAYDASEYYRSLQMGLPALYYQGRCDPPHPEIWMEYFLRMVELYARKASDLASAATSEAAAASLSHLKPRERAFYEHLVEQGVESFAPVDMARVFGVSNRTIINWSAALAANGLLEPVLVKQRIRSYKTVFPGKPLEADEL